MHTVFNVGRNEILPLVDEGWSMRSSVTGLPTGRNGMYTGYNINMGRVIGTNGETTLRIIVKGNTSEIISAYPIT